MDLHAHMRCEHNEIRREQDACGVREGRGETQTGRVTGGERENDGVSRVRTEKGGGDKRLFLFLCAGTWRSGGRLLAGWGSRAAGNHGRVRDGFWRTLCI